jgi:hypothetical protein
MSSDKYGIDDVFGINRTVPLNYVYRQSVDDEFVSSLTRQKHIVVYGSSKQGKTSLRKHHLRDDEYILVTCSNKWSLPQLMTSFLKQAGYTIEQSSKVTVSGQAKVTARAKISAKLFGSGGEAEGSAEGSIGRTKETTEVELELDPSDINDIIKALKRIGLNEWIVLEDFHYLPDETQRDFAVALKAFHENSDYTFIIVGVWLQENRLVQYNGDLSGRISTINADRWSHSELREAIDIGETYLNVEFSDEFKAELVAASYDSIYVVQESCHLALEKASISYTQDNSTRVSGDPAVLVRDVVSKQSARYLDFLVSFSQGFGSTELEMYKWLLVPIVMSEVEQHEEGLELREIRRVLGTYHPRGKELNAGNVTQALKSFAALQIQQGMKPIVFDYDQSRRRLNVVDRSFLIWLANQDRREILDAVDLPESIADTWTEQLGFPTPS